MQMKRSPLVTDVRFFVPVIVVFVDGKRRWRLRGGPVSPIEVGQEFRRAAETRQIVVIEPLDDHAAFAVKPFDLLVAGAHFSEVFLCVQGDVFADKVVGGVLKCMLINEGQTKSNGDTVYLSCANSNYRLLSPLPWTEYKAKRQIRQ